MHPRCSLSPSHTRFSVAAPRQNTIQKRKRLFQLKDLHVRGDVPRACVYVGLQNDCKGDGIGAHTRGSRGPNRTICVAQPRTCTYNSSGQGWLYPHRGDQLRCDAQSHFGIRDRIRAFKKDFSSILLDKMKTKYLILGPGGMGYFAMLGAYTRMYSELKDVEAIAGSSSGAILGLLISIGKTPQEIYDISFDVNIKDLVKYNIKSFLDNYGLIDHSQIKEKLISICEWEPKFKDIDMDLYIAAFNVSHTKTEYFSKHTHPEMSVIDAVCMSISVPFLFSSVKHDNKVYIDGGTMECYPAPPFLNKNHSEVLVLRIVTSPMTTEVKNFKSFLDALVRSTLRNRVTYDKMFKTITLDLSDYNIFDFNMSEEEKLKLFFMYTYNK